MLLRLFGKIGPFTLIRIWILLVISVVGSAFLQANVPLTLVWMLPTASLFLVLTTKFYKERWLFRASAFRYLVIFFFVPLFSVEFGSRHLFLWWLAFEWMWHWAEHYASRPDVKWALGSGTLLGALLIAFLDQALVFVIAQVLIWSLLSRGGAKSWLQWIFATAIIVGTYWSICYYSDIEVIWTFPKWTFSPLWSWWIVPGVAFIATVGQVITSWRNANVVNRARTLLSSLWCLASVALSLLTDQPAAHAAALFALSMQVANAMHYFKRTWWTQGAFWLLLIFEAAQILDLIVIL